MFFTWSIVCSNVLSHWWMSSSHCSAEFDSEEGFSSRWDCVNQEYSVETSFTEGLISKLSCFLIFYIFIPLSLCILIMIIVINDDEWQFMICKSHEWRYMISRQDSLLFCIATCWTDKFTLHSNNIHNYYQSYLHLHWDHNHSWNFKDD